MSLSGDLLRDVPMLYQEGDTPDECRAAPWKPWAPGVVTMRCVRLKFGPIPTDPAGVTAGEA